MNTSTTATRLYNYDVTDDSSNKLGSVDGVWVDDATDRPEFISVKTGWLFGKSHMIPIENAQIDDENQAITVPYSQDQVKNGPSFATDAELSPDDEQQIYSYYGMQRSTATSPTGYAGGGTASTDQPLSSESGEIEVPEVEEELQVGKREVQSGGVRLHKVVRTEHEEVPVELRRQDIQVERVPANQVDTTDLPSDAFQEKEIDVPLKEEQPVVGKEARVTGGVRVSKDVETQQQNVGGEVRQTDWEVEREGTQGVEDNPDTSTP